MSYVQTVLNALMFPACPAMKPANNAVTPRPMRPVVTRNQERQSGVVVDLTALLDQREPAAGIAGENESDQAGKDHDEGKCHLEERGEDRSHPCRT